MAACAFHAVKCPSSIGSLSRHALLLAANYVGVLCAMHGFAIAHDFETVRASRDDICRLRRLNRSNTGFR
jgi:hypothetical protein